MSINNNPINDNPFVKVGRSLFCGGTIRHHKNSDGTFVEGEKVSVKDTVKLANEFYGDKKKWNALSSDEKLAAKGHIYIINTLGAEENKRLMGINVARKQQIDAFYEKMVGKIFDFEPEVTPPLVEEKQPDLSEQSEFGFTDSIQVSLNKDSKKPTSDSNDFEDQDSLYEFDNKLEEISDEASIDLTQKSEQKFGLIKSVARTLAPYAKSVAKYAIDCYFSMTGSKQQDLIEEVIAFEDRPPVQQSAKTASEQPKKIVCLDGKNFVKIDGGLVRSVSKDQLGRLRNSEAKIEYPSLRDIAQELNKFSKGAAAISMVSLTIERIQDINDDIDTINEAIEKVNKDIKKANEEVDCIIDKGFEGLISPNSAAVDDTGFTVEGTPNNRGDVIEDESSGQEERDPNSFGTVVMKGLLEFGLSAFFGITKQEPIEKITSLLQVEKAELLVLRDNDGKIVTGNTLPITGDTLPIIVTRGYKGHSYESTLDDDLQLMMKDDAQFRADVWKFLENGPSNLDSQVTTRILGHIKAKNKAFGEDCEGFFYATPTAENSATGKSKRHELEWVFGTGMLHYTSGDAKTNQVVIDDTYGFYSMLYILKGKVPGLNTSASTTTTIASGHPNLLIGELVDNSLFQKQQTANSLL
jgi:hypothetical protein